MDKMIQHIEIRSTQRCKKYKISPTNITKKINLNERKQKGQRKEVVKFSFINRLNRLKQSVG